MTTYISDSAHYKEVLARIPRVRHSLWIGIADIKDVYMDLPAGCGIAGYAPEMVAPCFKEAAELENVCLPEEFWVAIQL
ncbi:MAG: hypothetical protein ACI3Z5_03775 [Paludibacteraceae bacterium]